MEPMEPKIFTFDLAGRPLKMEIGKYANFANGSVLVRYGDTAVITTAVASKETKDTDFFPLTVNYEERLYAVGKIPGGFIKREGRPSEKAVLASRLIDRPIRPLFPEGLRNEVPGDRDGSFRRSELFSRDCGHARRLHRPFHFRHSL